MFEIHGFNEIEQQTDVYFLIADVIIPCSYMRTLSLTIPVIYISSDIPDLNAS